MAADLVSELNSLDFSAYIGGPMQAAVDAQNSAAMAQVDFIQKVGLEPTELDNDNNVVKSKVRMVDFTYTSNDGGVETTKTLQVPFLTMLSIPALRIDEMTIDFNCKLNSVATSHETQDVSVGASLNLNVWKVKLNVTAAYKQSTSKSEQVERTYSMSVHVKVVNDEMPAGLDRVLNILENEIRAVSEEEEASSDSPTNANPTE